MENKSHYKYTELPKNAEVELFGSPETVTPLEGLTETSGESPAAKDEVETAMEIQIPIEKADESTIEINEVIQDKNITPTPIRVK